MTLAALAERLGARLLGDGSVTVARVADFRDATAADLGFAETDAAFAAALDSPAAAIIASEALRESCRSVRENRARPALLLVREPRLAFARAAALLTPTPRRVAGIHPSAVVAPSAALGPDVSVGPHAFIDDEVVVGERTTIGPGVVLQRGVKIGPACELVARIVVYSGTTLGAGVIVHAGVVLGSDGFGYVRDPETGRHERFPQMGTLEIGDDVEIGANTTIDRAALGRTVVAAGTKIDNLVQIAHNVSVGRNVILAAQTGIAGSSRLDDDVVVAGQVGIADHVHIETGVRVGAQAGVPTGKVLRGRGQVYWGTPARPIKEYLRELAVLSRLASRRRAPDA